VTTIAQLVKNGRKRLVTKTKSPALKSCPRKGSLYQGLHDYAEKAELGFEEGGKGEAYQCYGSHRVYPWCRT